VRVIVLLAVAFLAGPAYCEDRMPARGDKVTLRQAFYACPKLNDFKLMKRLALIEHDDEAAHALASKRCQLLRLGGRFTIEDTSLLNIASCIRPAGEAACLWTSDGVIAFLN
jgi:hypothetical protein